MHECVILEKKKKTSLYKFTHVARIKKKRKKEQPQQQVKIDYH